MKKVLVLLFLLLFLTGCKKEIENYDDSILESVSFSANTYGYDKNEKNWFCETLVLVKDDVPYDEVEFDYELGGKYIDILFETKNYQGSELIQDGNHVKFVGPKRFIDEYTKEGNSHIVSFVTIRFKELKDCEEINFSLKNITLRNSKTGEVYKVKDTNKLIRCPQDLKK